MKYIDIDNPAQVSFYSFNLKTEKLLNYAVQNDLSVEYDEETGEMIAYDINGNDVVNLETIERIYDYE